MTQIIPRRLVACWYHIACQLDYTPELNKGDSLESEELFAETLGLLVENKAKKFSELFTLINDENYKSEDDSDYDPEAVSEGEDDNDEEVQEVNEVNEVNVPKKFINDSMENPISDKEQQIRAIIFPVVRGLGAYMPSPIDDLPWFKRSLKHIHFCQKIGDTSWYPWGCPPVVALVDSLKSTDQHQSAYASSILQLFKQSTESYNSSGHPDH